MVQTALTVRVIGAMDVTSTSKRTKYLKGTPDLYVQVTVLPAGSSEEGKRRTKVVSLEGTDPKWNDVLEFTLLPSVLLSSIAIDFEVFDQNRGRDTPVAKASFSVSRYAGKGLQSGEEWMSLTSGKKEACGRLHAQVAWAKLSPALAPAMANGCGEEKGRALAELANKHSRKNRRNNELYRQFSGLEPKPAVGTVDEPCTVHAPDQMTTEARVVLTEELELQFFKGRKHTAGQGAWKTFPLHHCKFADVRRQELLDSYDSATLYSASEGEGSGNAGVVREPSRSGSGEQEEGDEWQMPAADVVEAVTPGIVQFQALFRGYRERKCYKKRSSNAKRRGHLVQELLSTERKYVESLEVLTDVLLAPMKESEGMRGLTSALYEHAVGLLQRHLELLPRLEELASGWTEEKEGLGELFATIAGFSESYTSYVKHYSEVLALVSVARRQPDNAALIAELERDPRCNRAQLNSFLILPVQRVPRYRMFLTDLVKYAPEGHADLAPLHEAATHISKLATTMDEHCMSIENVKKVIAIQEKFVGQPTFAEPSRHYVREANMALWPGRQQHRVFLLNDLLIVASIIDKEAKEGREGASYKLRTAVHLKDIVLFPMGQDGFQLADACTGQISVMLSCPSAAVQAAWVADLRTLLEAPAMRQENRKLQFEHQLRLQQADSNTIRFDYCGATWRFSLENRIRKDKILNTLLGCGAFLRAETVAELCTDVGRASDRSRGRKGSTAEGGVDISAYRELVKLTSDDDSCHSAVKSALSSLLEVVEKEQAMAGLASTYGSHLHSVHATKEVQNQLLLQQTFIQAESNFATPSVWKKVSKRAAPAQLTPAKSTLLSGFLHGTSNLSKDLHKRGRPRRASTADISRTAAATPQASGLGEGQAPAAGSRSRSRKDLRMAGLEGEVAALRASLDSVVASQTQANSTVASLLVTIEKQEVVSQRVLRQLEDGSAAADRQLVAANEEQAARILALERDLLVKDKEIELLHLRLASLEASKKAAEADQADTAAAALLQQEQSAAAIAGLAEQVAALTSFLTGEARADRSAEAAAPAAAAPGAEGETKKKVAELSPKKNLNRRSMSLATVTKGFRRKVSKSGDAEEEASSSSASTPSSSSNKDRKRERRQPLESSGLAQSHSESHGLYAPQEPREDSPDVSSSSSKRKAKRKSRSEKEKKRLRKKERKKREKADTDTEFTDFTEDVA